MRVRRGGGAKERAPLYLARGFWSELRAPDQTVPHGVRRRTLQLVLEPGVECGIFYDVAGREDANESRGSSHPT